MRTQELNSDFISVPKETFRCIISDFERLLEDFESIEDVETAELAEKRLKDFKEGRIKAVGEEEFRGFLKSEGIK